jgi:hypothetical protein
MTWPLPTPEEQVQFLRNVQRLLDEGLFVASYKFALIHALADLAVLKGDCTGAPLDLETRDTATKFVELYWRQWRHAGAEPSGPDPSPERWQTGSGDLAEGKLTWVVQL